MSDLAKLFTERVLSEASNLAEIQVLLMNLTKDNLQVAKGTILNSTLSSAQILRSVFVAAEYRPRAIEALVELCKLIKDAKQWLLERMSRPASLNTEQLFFLYQCMKAGLVTEKEAGISLSPPYGDNAEMTLALFGNVIKEHHPEAEAGVEKILFTLEPFEIPIQNDDIDAFVRIFEQGNIATDSRVKPSILYGCHFIRDRPTLLQYAAFFGAAKVFTFLVEKGAGLAFGDSRNRSLAQFAVAGGNPQIINFCKSQGLDFAGTVRIAVRFHRNELAKQLTDTTSPRILHQSCVSSNVALMLDSIAKGLSVNEFDPAGSAPLHVAAQFNAADAVWLLSQHPSVNVNDRTRSDGYTALHIAAMHGFLETVDVLLSCPNIDQRISDNHGLLPVHVAAHYDRRRVMEILLNQGTVTFDTRTDRGETPLHLAVRENSIAAIELLLRYPGIDVNAQTLNKETILHGASQYNRVAALQCIIDHGYKLDVNVQDKDGWTPLHYATQKLHIEAIELLTMQPNLDVNCKNASGLAPLHMVARMGNVELFRMFLQFPKIDVNVADNGGWTSLHFAAKGGAKKIVELLLKRKDIDVNARDGAGWTPLHDATKYMSHPVMRVLLQRKDVDVNARTNANWVPLHLACLNHDEQAQALLKERSEIILDAKDNEGRTPDDLANIPMFGGTEALPMMTENAYF
jgi:ankyrin repeat protein